MNDQKANKSLTMPGLTLKTAMILYSVYEIIWATILSLAVLVLRVIWDDSLHAAYMYGIDGMVIVILLREFLCLITAIALLYAWIQDQMWLCWPYILQSIFEITFHSWSLIGHVSAWLTSFQHFPFGILTIFHTLALFWKLYVVYLIRKLQNQRQYHLQ